MQSGTLITPKPWLAHPKQRVCVAYVVVFVITVCVAGKKIPFLEFTRLVELNRCQSDIRFQYPILTAIGA